MFLKIFVILVALTALLWLSQIGPYAYACWLESHWFKAHPKTKTELESHLYLYSERAIDPKTSLWGHDDKLGKKERMVQYLILWSQPLDVVYDDQDSILRIYTSYE